MKIYLPSKKFLCKQNENKFFVSDTKLRKTVMFRERQFGDERENRVMGRWWTMYFYREWSYIWKGKNMVKLCIDFSGKILPRVTQISLAQHHFDFLSLKHIFTTQLSSRNGFWAICVWTLQLPSSLLIKEQGHRTGKSLHHFPIQSQNLLVLMWFWKMLTLIWHSVWFVSNLGLSSCWN